MSRAKGLAEDIVLQPPWLGFFHYEIFMYKEGYFCFLVLQASGFGKEKVLHEPLGGHRGLEVVIGG